MEEHKVEKKEFKRESTNNISPIQSKIKKNPWIVYTIVLAIVAIVLAYFLYKSGGLTGNTIGANAAGEKLVTYLNSKTGGGVELVSSKDSGSLYEVMVTYQGNEIPVYITKDGSYFIQGVVPIEDSNTPATTNTNTNTQTPEVVKSDKPKVELFVMTECPYGTQAEKGIIPVLELLGNKIDAQISFVHYFMHGDKEEQETYTQVCIREEQADKYMAYLSCYLEDGNSSRCIDKVKVSKTKLSSCVKDKAKNYYATDSAASEAAGVSGSPTLVINGQIVNSGRSSSAFLQTICSAFNTVPSECSEVLSSTNPSAGFGTSASGSNTAASCG
jgi:hypothetical protein